MSRQLAVAGLGVGVAAAACLLGRGPGPVMIPASPAPAAEPSSAAAAAAAAAADGAAGRRTRSRFRTHQGAETAVVGCSTGKEYLSCVDHFVGRGDSVLIIRGTTDGTADKDSTAKADQERAERAAGADDVHVYEGDVWDLKALLALAASTPTGAFTVVCLQLGNVFGNDMLCDALALIRMLRSVLAPALRAIVIRSRVMAQHGRCYHDSRAVIGMPPFQRDKLAQTSNHHCQVIAGIGVSDYRDTIPTVARAGCRNWLEIGTCVGTTAFLMAEAVGEGGSVVGIDIGKLCITRARNQQSKLGGHSARIQFEVADAWDMSALQRLDPVFDTIYIDVGGLSGADGEFEAVALVRMLCCTFKTLRFIVIKSRCLRHHASVHTYGDAVLSTNDGWIGAAPAGGLDAPPPDAPPKASTKDSKSANRKR